MIEEGNTKKAIVIAMKAAREAGNFLLENFNHLNKKDISSKDKHPLIS